MEVCQEKMPITIPATSVAKPNELEPESERLADQHHGHPDQADEAERGLRIIFR